jgi:hypothetical protein
MSNGVVGLRVRVNATLVDGALHQYAEEMSCRGNERGGQAPNRPRGPSRRGLLPARGQETSHTRHLQVVTGGLQRRDCRRGLEQHLKGSDSVYRDTLASTVPFSVFATGVSAWCDKCPLLFVAWPDSTDRRELGFYSLSLSRTPSSVVATC